MARETKIIEYPSRAAAESAILSLYAQMHHTFRGNTAAYNNVWEHPTDNNRFAVAYIVGGNDWKIVYDFLNPNELGKLKQPESDWFVTEV